MKRRNILVTFACLIFGFAGAQVANFNTIVFSNDGQLFASNYENGAIEVHELTKGKKIFEIKGKRKWEYSDFIESLSISPNKKYLAIAPGGNAPTRIMDITSGKEVTTVEFGQKAIFTNSGKLVTIKEKQLQIYSSDGFSKEKTMLLPDFPSDDANPCTLDATTEKIIIPLFYSDYVIIDAGTGNVVNSHIEDTKDKLESIQVSMDSKSIITCTQNSLKVFSIGKDALLFKKPIDATGFQVPAACLSETGLLYLKTMEGNSIRCFNIITGDASASGNMEINRSSGMPHGIYFAPRSGVCCLASSPYNKKTYFSFINVITQTGNRIFLE